MADKYPKVSFLIPILNEEKTIKACLDSLFELDYPRNKIEILIARGLSDDNTDKIIDEYVKTYRNIKLFENPTGSRSRCSLSFS